jgi:hypothetical protein
MPIFSLLLTKLAMGFVMTYGTTKTPRRRPHRRPPPATAATYRAKAGKAMHQRTRCPGLLEGASLGGAVGASDYGAVEMRWRNWLRT